MPAAPGGTVAHTPMQEVTGELANAAQRPAEQSSDPVDVLLANATARRFADVADHARHTAEGTSARVRVSRWPSW